MQLSNNGLKFIKIQEGFEPHIYKDSAGLDTVGYGHLIRHGEDFSGGISEQAASRLLAQDVLAASRAVNSSIKVPLTQNQFDALVSFTFNLGGEALRGYTLLRLLNAGDYAGAAGQFGRWNKAKGRVVAGLTRRREAERELFVGSS